MIQHALRLVKFSLPMGREKRQAWSHQGSAGLTDAPVVFSTG
jgi:hypothetical protein